MQIGEERRECRPRPRIARNLLRREVLRGKCRIRLPADDGDGAVRQTVRKKSPHLIRKGKALRQEQLCRHTAIELIHDLLRRMLARVDGIERFARRDVRAREDELSRRRLVQEHDVDVGRITQCLIGERRARRDHLHYFAVRQPLCLRVADLLGNRHLEPLCDETRDIAVRRMIGNAAHGILLEIAAAARQRQPELLRRHLRIVEEHLVEIAQTKEKKLARMRLFRGEILLHHRRHILRVHNKPPKSCDKNKRWQRIVQSAPTVTLMRVTSPALAGEAL